jgi:hypothetical protein
MTTTIELTAAQAAALAGHGGVFRPHLDPDAPAGSHWVEFTDEDGHTAPLAISVWWSSVTPGLLTVAIDTNEGAPADTGGAPALRVTLNDSDIYEQTRTA